MLLDGVVVDDLVVFLEELEGFKFDHHLPKSRCDVCEREYRHDKRSDCVSRWEVVLKNQSIIYYATYKIKEVYVNVQYQN